MATDTDRIREFIATRQSEDTYKTLSAAYLSLKTTLGRYIRAYMLIMLIMFLELTLGFFVAGIKRFALYALLVAIFDILPILGSSMILLPWSLVLLLTGDIRRGAIMFVVYVIVVVVRQFIEPKIVGEHVGLHPLITLIAMYVGVKLFGGIGLFGLPMCCAVLVQLENAGFLNLFPKRRDLYKAAS
jgi:sporulation integral membrane protein YtvI